MAINKIITKPPKSHSGLKNCLAYVLRSDKTEQTLTAITGPYHHKELNANFAYQSFLQEKKIWHKDKGRMCLHSIISWHKDEKITQEKAFAFGQEFAEKWFAGFQTVIAVHQDRDHIHCHLVTNSVSYEDGRKYHTSKKDLERMKLSGWNVHWKDSRKHITFENKDGKKVRDSNLFKTFHLDVGKEGLEREFIRQRENTELSEQELEQYYRQLVEILMQEMSHKLRESLCLNQELSEVNHNLQEELRKVLTDLSDITRLNQQLSIENDNLRNRGGWMLREQQEKLEREIADVQDQNSRLNRLVNMSNVTAYEKMRRERDDALNQVAEERQKTFMAKKNFREDINKVNKKTNDKVLDMKNRMQFWQIVSIGTLIVGFLIGWIL